MSFKIDGEEWTPQTISDHVSAWMEYVNAQLEAENIKDANGNIAQLKQNFANAMYLLILAGSSRLEKNDEKLNAAINSFNVSVCDNTQLENLLPIAAIERNMGSYSTLVLTATASDEGVCTIPAGTKAPYGDVNFVVQEEVVLQPGTTQNFTTVCDTVGAIVVLAGEVTSFENQIPNLQRVINAVSSTPGTSAETTESLRNRILMGETIPYSLNGVKRALESLTGIAHARVFFNYNTSSSITIAGNIEIQPRTAYIVINGHSDNLADTYARYMSAPTQNAPGASPTGSYTTVVVNVTADSTGSATVPAGTHFVYDGTTFASSSSVTIAAGATEAITFTALTVGAVVIPAGSVTAFSTSIDHVDEIENEASVPGVDKTAYTQDFVSSSGQLIPIKYDVASKYVCHVMIYLKSTSEYDTSVEAMLKRDLITASASWEIGEAVTTMNTSSPFKNITYAEVAYTKVSTDGETWTDMVETPANMLPHISDDTITVEVLE